MTPYLLLSFLLDRCCGLIVTRTTTWLLSSMMQAIETYGRRGTRAMICLHQDIPIPFGESPWANEPRPLQDRRAELLGVRALFIWILLPWFMA
jgi:hypothetical protein